MPLKIKLNGIGGKNEMCDYRPQIHDNAITNEEQKYSTRKPLQRPKIYNRLIIYLRWTKIHDANQYVASQPFFFVYFLNLSNTIQLY